MDGLRGPSGMAGHVVHQQDIGEELQQAFRGAVVENPYKVVPPTPRKGLNAMWDPNQLAWIDGPGGEKLKGRATLNRNETRTKYFPRQLEGCPVEKRPAEEPLGKLEYRKINFDIGPANAPNPLMNRAIKKLRLIEDGRERKLVPVDRVPVGGVDGAVGILDGDAVDGKVHI